MLKVAIIGCGKIADAHASQILRVEGCQLVGACDREELMAEQFAQRFRVPARFQEAAEMLRQTHPDVVHITTPPQSHYPLARLCLEQGAHVYVEKPFTLNAPEAEELLALAARLGRKITAGHDDQFRHAARRMRQLIRDGYLGGPPVHMESYYGYELSSAGYAKALLADPHHWVRQLPGGLLQNIISHGLARIAEYLTTEDPTVIAHGCISPLLRQLGERQIVDELRVILAGDNGTTAYFTFSTQMRPSLHQFRVYGPKNGLLMDQDHETLLRLRGTRHKSYLEQFLPPVNFARQYVANLTTNVRSFLARDFHMKSGMKYLIEAFYRSIVAKTPVPIPEREILWTARVMDRIFQQLSAAKDGGLSGEAPSVRRMPEPAAPVDRR